MDAILKTIFNTVIRAGVYKAVRKLSPKTMVALVVVAIVVILAIR